MLFINADDWGGWASATDAALACHREGRITSVSAMVFMEDSERAVGLAKDSGVDVGLHLNLNQDFSASNCPAPLRQGHARIKRFLNRSKYAQLIYNPFLRKDFRAVYQAQSVEFVRLYGRAPSHVDGHRHLHLCINMLLEDIIPKGQKVRRSFSFSQGEKNFINRAYRRWVDNRLAARYRLTDYFFSLSQQLQWGQITRVIQLSQSASVELMAHPEWDQEYSFLMGKECEALLPQTPGQRVAPPAPPKPRIGLQPI